MHRTHGEGHHHLTMVVVEMVTYWLSKKQMSRGMGREKHALKGRGSHFLFRGGFWGAGRELKRERTCVGEGKVAKHWKSSISA